MSAVSGGEVALALDAVGTPWLAAVNADRSIRVGQLVNGALQFTAVPGVKAGQQLAFGLRGATPIVAVSDTSLLIAEQGESWQTRAAPWLCKPILLERGGSAIPTVAIDHQGEVWQACVDATFGPYRAPTGPQMDIFMNHVAPVVAARLRLGRLVGKRWVELPAKSVPTSSRTAILVMTAAGEIDVHFDWQPQASFRIDPVRRVFVPTAKVQTAVGAAPVALPDARLVQRGQRRFGVVGKGSCFAQSCFMTLGIADGDEPWRPLTGAWSFGLNGPGVAASRPALALDRCGNPVVAWNEGAKNMVLQRWDGQAFRRLATVPGDGPHGLAVDAQDDVWIGAWGRVNRNAMWQLTRVHEGTQHSLPPLTPSGSEWIFPVQERTRLTVNDGIRMSFPRSAGAPREGFVLTEEQWRPDRTTELLLPTTTLPYANQIVAPDFWTPDRVYATRSAALSALAFDAAKRPLIAWADELRLHVSLWNGAAWQPISDESLPPTMISDAPALSASHDRVCIAWSSAGATDSVFVRCHRLPPLAQISPVPSK